MIHRPDPDTDIDETLGVLSDLVHQGKTRYIGPRTLEHLASRLAGADVELSDDVLNRIDQIVPPGTTINDADNGWTARALQPAYRRR